MRSPGAKMDGVFITRNFTVKDAQREGSWAAPLTVGQTSAQRLLLRSEGVVNSTDRQVSIK
jgi:hypothetical protein